MRGLLRRPSKHEQTERRAAATSLRALDALLSIDRSGSAFTLVFETLHPLFDFDRALVLESTGDTLHCIAAVPPEWVGKSWNGDLFREVIGGRVLVSHRDVDHGAWSGLPADLVSLQQPALAFPIALQDHCAVLLLAREQGKVSFDEEQIALARHAAVLALAGLAMRGGDRLENEIQRLNLLVDRLRESEESAHKDYNFLREIVERLPSGVTVRDGHGRSMLINAVAAAGIPADEEAARNHLLEVTSGRTDEVSFTEDSVADDTGIRTWLTSHRPVRILDQTLLLSCSTDITERKQIENEWTRRAYFDDLTGLPNRLFIQEHVESVINRAGTAERFALAFIDIDNFKHVNDYYSHAIGDALLVKVAMRIAEHIRETDMLARISGDEFLLLIDPVDDADQVRSIIDRILTEMKRPFHIDNYEIFSSASIGVSTYPDHGRDYEALRRNADNAMYRVKSGTKGEALFFDSEMGRSIVARMEHEQQLRLAIRDNRFCCAFQPKVNIYTQEVVGFESLVRWRDENGENRPPSTFVSLAVELGLIDTITQFIMTETIKSIERLDESFGAGTNFSINVPAKLAGDINFMRPLVDTLKASGHAERIMLELTEEAFVATNPFQMQVLPMLRDIGVRISIDDFGTGYSSLAALADITADELKVDRSFITDIHRRPRSQSILKSIESLGHALGMSIIAEGVETIEELAYLQEATRICYAQGFYFSKPFFLDEACGRVATSGGRGLESPRERLDMNRYRASRGRGF
jgi:diguanylate cyclase (GGDEF)-like protein